ncbi:hypothetical protein EBX93_14100, partial [bacterium]|nr:hypothetical protein [bacterium]
MVFADCENANRSEARQGGVIPFLVNTFGKNELELLKYFSSQIWGVFDKNLSSLDGFIRGLN